MRMTSKGLITRIVRHKDSITVYVDQEYFRRIVNKPDFDLEEFADYMLNRIEAELGIMDIIRGAVK